MSPWPTLVDLLGWLLLVIVITALVLMAAVVVTTAITWARESIHAALFNRRVHRALRQAEHDLKQEANR